MSFSSNNCSTSLTPNPSISKALRDAKCLIACLHCAGQNKPPVQRATASSSNCSTLEPQTGQFSGMTILSVLSRRFSGTTRATSGITSPALRTITISPMRTSLRLISSILCKVALVTVTPPTNTGSSLATGVNAPVLPT